MVEGAYTVELRKTECEIIREALLNEVEIVGYRSRISKRIMMLELAKKFVLK